MSICYVSASLLAPLTLPSPINQPTNQPICTFSVDHRPSAMSVRSAPWADGATEGATMGGKGGSTGASGQDVNTPYDYFLPGETVQKIGTQVERDFFAGGVDRRCKEIACLMDYLHAPAGEWSGISYIKEHRASLSSFSPGDCGSL